MTGILLVDKPVGLSSAVVVEVVKRATREHRVGHGGTLDPFASGLLPVLIGREYTRRAVELMEGEKEYLATLRFGTETDTCDLRGRVVGHTGRWPVSEDAIRGALPALRGALRQEPPAFSALKQDGRPLYWYARRGMEVTKPARVVQVFEVELVEYLPPDAVIRVVCGKGTYVRSLGRDLGRGIGCLAHLIALRRTRLGPYPVADAVPLWRVRLGVEPGWVKDDNEAREKGA